MLATAIPVLVKRSSGSSTRCRRWWCGCPLPWCCYTSAAGPLPRRLLAALNAAQAAGGDARGVMSAALVVVGAAPGDRQLVDLRVDRSADPLGELARLLDAADAYTRFNRATDHLFGGDAQAALADVEEGLGVLPGEPNLLFLRAGALLAGGEVDAGRRQLHSLLATHPAWEIVVRGFAAKGLLPLPAPTAIDQLLA
jgi:hypothetical protein